MKMSRKPKITTLQSIKTAELHSIDELLGAIERARVAGDWLDEEVFAEILSVGMRLVARPASALASEVGVSKSAVSKWLNRTAVPSEPARRTVVLWLEEHLVARQAKLDAQIISPCLEPDDDNLIVTA